MQHVRVYVDVLRWRCVQLHGPFVLMKERAFHQFHLVPVRAAMLERDRDVIPAGIVARYDAELHPGAGRWQHKAAAEALEVWRPELWVLEGISGQLTKITHHLRSNARACMRCSTKVAAQRPAENEPRHRSAIASGIMISSIDNAYSYGY